MKKKLILFLSIFSITLLGLTGCDLLENKLPEQETSSGIQNLEGPVLARVNGWSLTPLEFGQEVQNIIAANNGEPRVPIARFGPLFRTFVGPYTETIDLSSTNGKQIYLDYLVNLYLLAKEAKSRGLDKRPEIAENIKRSTTEILDFALLNETLKDITVTPLEVENFYQNEYKQTLENIEQRKVREIVVNSESKARNILVQLLKGEANFGALARINSIAESAKDSGDLGYLVYQPDQKFTKFWEAVLTLDQGQVSSIFKNPETGNYYIVKIEDIKKGEPESLNKIYDQLEFILKQRKSLEAINKLINNAKSKANVVTNHNLIP